MKVCDYLRRYIDRGLWIILEGTNLSESEKKELESALQEISSCLECVTSQPNQQRSAPFKLPERGILSSDQQVLWLLARLFRKLKGTEHILLTKNAGFESLLTRLDAPENIAKILRSLNDAVSNSLLVDGREMVLPQTVAEFLQSCLLFGDLDAATGIISCILSPYLSHLSSLDSDLLKISQDAMQSLLDNHGSANSAVLLHLLAMSSDGQSSALQVHRLINEHWIQEKEVFLALLARRESPPSCIQNFCNMESHSLKDIVSKDGLLQARQAFIRQNERNCHWFIDYLEALVKYSSQIENPEPNFFGLGPILLFYLWSGKCCESPVIVNSIESSKSPTFQRLGHLLRKRELVMQWIQRQENHNVKAVLDAVFSLLQKYSTLNVLHQSGALVHSNSTEIQELLEKCNQGLTKDSWESITFQGFCILTKAMNLFYLAGESRRPLDFQQYQESALNIKEELAKMQSQLKGLNPLNFRLEILENIFSLLFVRFEHLRIDEVSSDSGGEDEESLKSLATVIEASHSPDLLPQDAMDQDQPDSPALTGNQEDKIKLPPKGILRSGFLCGPLIIRDTLIFMKECLIECSSALYKQKSSNDLELDPQMQKKISLFSQSVTEAWWRLQLVTDISDVVDYEKKSKSYIPQPQRGYISSESSSDSDCEELDKLKIRKTSYKSSRSDNTDKSSGSGSNTTGGFGSSSSTKGKKVSRRKSHALNKLPHETDSIINVLLANPSSLALLCLERSDYSKAQQVVQTFQLSNSEIAHEANFLELFHSLSAEVTKTPNFCSSGNTFRDFATDMSPTNTKMIVSSSLEMVRKAASIGMCAISVTSLVEKILAMAPVVHGMEKLTLENRQANLILSGINEKAMVSVDAAMSLGLSSGASFSLMDVVSQHIKFASTKPGIKGRGYAHFVTSFMELFRNLYSKGKCGSAAETLSSWDIPLTLPFLNNHLAFNLDLHSALTDYLNNSTSARVKIGSIRQMINNLAECSTYYETKGVRDIGKDTLPYLQHLFWYVQTLMFVLERCSAGSSKDLSNPFDLLKEGWESLLSRLIFDLEAPLTRVERVSNRLNLNLLQAIVSACCPTFLQFEPANEMSYLHQPTATAWAKISLNAVTSQQDENGNPNDLAGEILSDLLEALRQSDFIIITSSDLPILSNKPEIVKILGETTKLSSINLGSLEEDHEKTTFLCNICNLLILHSLISLGHRSGLTSSSWSEKRSAYNCIGYHVGQMGFVSLSGLLRQLVGPDFDNNLEAKSGGNLMWSLENKQTLFSISQGTVQSPLVQVYKTDKFESQIQSAIANYVMHNVRVEGSISEGCFSLVITPLILQYLGLSSPSSLDPAVEAQDESLPPIPQQYMPVTSMACDCSANIPAILEFLEAYVTGQLKLQLKDWREAWDASNDDDRNKLIIIVEDPPKKLGILLQSSMDVLSPDLLQSSIASDLTPMAESWENCNLSPRILQYLGKRCWIVALLGERLRRGSQEYQFWPHTESLDRYLGEKFAQLSAFGDGNLILAALKPPRMLLSEVWPILDKLIFDQNDDECIQLIVSLPESMIFENVRLQTFRDLLLFYAASQSRRHGIEAPHRLALSLGTAELRAQCILKCIQFWSGDDSIEALKAVLGDPKILKDTRKEVLNALKKVVIYQQVHKVLCYYQPIKTSRLDGWYQILCLSDTDPGQVLQALIEAKQFRLCLQWAELHGVPSKANHLIDCNFVAPLLDSSDSSNYAAAEKLLSSVPIARAVSICRRLLASLSSMTSLQFVVNFALKSCKSWLEQNSNVWASLQLWFVGLSILGLLPDHEQTRDRSLASKPHLLVEQLLMNTKLAVLSEALKILRNADLNAVSTENPSHPMAIDAMLRSYANKALDFRVAQRVVPEVTTPIEPGDLLQSLSTGSTGSGPTPFVMPLSPPTKDGWVPNDEVTECMCCHLVPFSMFNRRHHCRRCGRVVCSLCSNHRAKVDGYGELQVRVCDDCFLQMKQDTLPEVNKNAEPSVHSSQQTYIIEWTLTGDEDQDETAREEFSFEHAPSVALCLSILGLHSEHAAAQPRFLLEAAEKMLKMLAPPTPGFVNPELDYSLVIRMARSLVVAAKVRYAKAALNSGVAHCDRLLGQVDLLSLLVKSGCANLLPVEPLPLSGHALRHLRDRLLSAELWSLALEVSTKAGLDRTGVWAAWGKACLRAGKWLEAREHLVHCLQPMVAPQDSVPTPLLSEIIRILEESSYLTDANVIKQSEHINSPALSVLHTLSSLSSISQGKLVVPDSSKQPSFYAECQYYLRTYGSPASTISFFLSHADLGSALRYTQDKSVESDVFAEALYKPCLVQGLVGQLFQEMKKMDPSLDMWKNTIMHVGRLLEQQGLWNSLYQLQLFARDLVRAAMTCIRFYKAGARCYSDMSAEQLIKARGHIEDELTTHWTASGLRRSVSVSSTRSSESPDASDSEFQIPLKMPARTLDHNINTISRQLEAAKFLQQCESEDRTAVVSVSSALHKLITSPGPTNLIPTLFGDSNERVLVAALILLCGKNIEEGFGTTFRIIQYFRLKADKVYYLVAQQLVAAGKTRQIPQLVNCILSSGSADASSCSDQLVVQCIQKLNEQSDGLVLAEPLLRLVNETEAKIQSHLICGFLKSAYLLAVKSGKMTYVKMILNEAEKLNQPAMKRVCLQWLAQNEKSQNN